MSKTIKKIDFISRIFIKKELLIVIAAFFALTSALLVEEFTNIIPCKLCLLERYVYLVVIVAGLLRIKFSRAKAIKYVFFISLVLLPALSLYHVLYEKDYIKTSIICDSNLGDENLSREEIKALIFKEKTKSCKTPVYVFKEVSFAELNFYYSCLLLGIFIFRRNAKN